MRIHFYTYYGGDIATTVVVDSDSLDPAGFHRACQLLTRLQLEGSPVEIGGLPTDPVYLGLGFPLEYFRQMMGDDPKLMGDVPTESTAVHLRTMFYLHHSRAVNIVQLIPQSVTEVPSTVSASIGGSHANLVVNGLIVRTLTREQEKAHFHEVAAQIFANRPSVLMDSWSASWDTFIYAFASAMLLGEPSTMGQLP